MKQTVCGLIGVGGIAQSQHLPNLSRSPHVDLKWLCDLDSTRLAQAHAQCPASRTTTDIDQVLSDDEVTMVVIATRDDAQAPLTIRALQAGKHVYVEKPLAPTADACKTVVEAQKKAERHVAVGFNRRFAPAYLQAKAIIDSHGGAYNLHYRISDSFYRWGPLCNYPAGSRIVHEVCHVFDVVRWLTGSEVQSVYCVQARDDDESIVMKMNSGSIATIMSSGFVDPDMPKEHLEVILKLGAVAVDDFAELRTYSLDDCRPTYTFPGHAHPQKEYTHKWLIEELGLQGVRALRRMNWKLNRRFDSMMNDPLFGEKEQIDRFLNHQAPNMNYMVDKGWQGAVDHFARCIADGKTPQTAGASDGYAAAALAAAAVESRRTGRVVPFDRSN